MKFLKSQILTEIEWCKLYSNEIECSWNVLSFHVSFGRITGVVRLPYFLTLMKSITIAIVIDFINAKIDYIRW